MAKKIIGGIGGLFGGKKKKTEAAAKTEIPETAKRWTPIIKQLGELPPAALRSIRRSRQTGETTNTILSNTLGG